MILFAGTVNTGFPFIFARSVLIIEMFDPDIFLVSKTVRRAGMNILDDLKVLRGVKRR